MAEGASYTVRCLSFGVEKVLTCGSDGNLTPSSVTCDDQISGAGKLALSAVLVAGAAILN